MKLQNQRSKGIVYHLWCGIKARCYNKNSVNYKHYGQKGIFICKEWLDYFVFEKWMLINNYTKEFSIDRKDNSKGYFPDNCRLILKTHQPRNRNKFSNTKNKITGVHYRKDCKLHPYRAEITINGKTKVLGYYSTELEASLSRDNYIIINKLENYKLNNPPTKK